MTSWWRRRPLHPTDEELSAYIDEEASSKDRERIRAHIDGCDACRERYEGLRSVQTMLSQVTQPAVPRSFTLTPELAGVQASTRAPVYTPQPPSRFRVPAFAPAVALTFFLAVLAVDLGGSSVSQQEDSGGVASSAPVRSAYSTDEAAKASGTPLLVPQASGPVLPPSTQSSAESAAGPNPALVPPVAPVAPGVPSVTNSAAGASPDAPAAASAPATSSGFGGATSPATTPGTVPAPRTGEAAPGSTPLPSTAQAAIPPSAPAAGDTFGQSRDLPGASTDAASQIAIEPGRPGADADGHQSTGDSDGIDAITVVEIALFLVFAGSLVAVVWQRMLRKEFS